MPVDREDAEDIVEEFVEQLAEDEDEFKISHLNIIATEVLVNYHGKNTGQIGGARERLKERLRDIHFEQEKGTE